SSVRDRVVMLRADLERGRTRALQRVQQAEIDRALLVELESIRGEAAEINKPELTDAAYAAAFHRAGLDIMTTDPAEAGRWIAARINAVELPPYLDHWALIRRRTLAPEAAWRRLLETARVADPDPWRDALRVRGIASDVRADAEFQALADAED